MLAAGVQGVPGVMMRRTDRLVHLAPMEPVRVFVVTPDDRISLVEAMDRFHKFAWGCDAFWSHGATFDLVIIENIYRQLGKPLPWNFWQLRDTRTLFDLGYDPDMPKNSKHDALQDAIRQSVGVQNIYSKLKIRPR